MNRIQRTRTRGAKLPPNTLCVTRGTLFGNDYKISETVTREEAVNKFRLHIRNPMFEWKIKAFMERCKRDGIKHIACWCKLNDICHGDVWLEIWNERIER